MSNPLFNAMNSAPVPVGNAQQLVQRFQQFRQMFTGNPQQQVQQLLNSGRVSQDQYNRAVQMANQLQRMLGGK